MVNKMSMLMSDFINAVNLFVFVFIYRHIRSFCLSSYLSIQFLFSSSGPPYNIFNNLSQIAVKLSDHFLLCLIILEIILYPPHTCVGPEEPRVSALHSSSADGLKSIIKYAKRIIHSCYSCNFTHALIILVCFSAATWPLKYRISVVSQSRVHLRATGGYFPNSQ